MLADITHIKVEFVDGINPLYCFNMTASDGHYNSLFFLTVRDNDRVINYLIRWIKQIFCTYVHVRNAIMSMSLNVIYWAVL